MSSIDVRNVSRDGEVGLPVKVKVRALAGEERKK